MNTKQLQYFIAAAENANFTKAAQQFHITQTAITQQIKSLEEQLQLDLFIRKNHYVKLTPAGEFFLKECQALIKNLDTAVDQARLIDKGISGSLRIGLINGFEQSPIHLLIRHFHEENPHISLYFERDSAANLYEKLQNNLLDMVFNMRFDIGRYRNILRLPIQEFSVVAVLPVFHPLAGKKYLYRDDLRDEPFIIVRPGETLTEQREALKRFMTANIKFGQIAYANDTETLMLMVSSGLGIAIIPEYMTQSISNKQIQSLPIKGINMKADIISAWRDGDDNPALTLMVKAISRWKKRTGYVPKPKRLTQNVTNSSTLSIPKSEVPPKHKSN